MSIRTLEQQWVGDTGDLPVIEVKPGILHKLATQGEAALVEAEVNFYARGGQIVRPVIDEVDASKGRKTKCARLLIVSPKVMLDYLSRFGRWERFNKKEKKAIRTDPPYVVAEIILARDGEWDFRPLAGVITTPTVRPDGSLLLTPGYDPVTRLLLIDPPAMPAIQEKPTRQDAKDALEFLRKPLSEFPYADAASRSVGLSLLMTPLIRGAIPAAPAHLSAAPAAGTGKSYQNDCASAIYSGQPCPVIAAGEDPREFEKQLVSALRSGQGLISIDNLSVVLKSDLLCQIIERPVVQVRPFRQNDELVTIENRATVLGTGNNLVVSGDMIRRQITCTLDANVEHPEKRKFHGDPFHEYASNRGRYIAAILTIVKAFQCAGNPDRPTPLASFERWSDLIRAPLMWLGEADPVATMEDARARDPEIAEFRSVVMTWKQVTGLRRPLFAREIKEAAEQDNLGKLKEALLTVAGVRSEVNVRNLGKWLTKYRNRIVGGVKLEAEEDRHTKVLVWQLKETNDA